MAWIPSYQELREHPKTRRLARKLGVPLPQAIGHLHLLWWWAMDYAPDGDLSRWEAGDIADAGGWEGDAGQFLSALMASGFVDTDEDLPADVCPMQLHDWDQYAGKFLAQRQRDAERLRSVRQSTGVRTAYELRSSDVRREEKREEENRGEEKREEGGSARAGAKPPRRPHEKLSEEQFQQLCDDFPELTDLPQRVEEALNHAAAKKAASEYLYLRNWLRKDAERSPQTRNGSRNNGARGSPGESLKASWEKYLGRPVGARVSGDG